MARVMSIEERLQSAAMQQQVTMSLEQLGSLMQRFAKLGAMEYDKLRHGQMISRWNAEKIYGRTTINRLEEIGAITSHKTTTDKYVIQRYNVTEIEAAIAAKQMSNIVNISSKQMKEINEEVVKDSAFENRYIYGIKELATVYCCSYAKAKMLRSKLAAACVKRGRHVVIDLNKAQKIIPLPSPGR